MNTDYTDNALAPKCLSLNVRGLNKSIKRLTVFDGYTNKIIMLYFCSNHITVSKILNLSGKTDGVAKFSLATAQTVVKVL